MLGFGSEVMNDVIDYDEEGSDNEDDEVREAREIKNFSWMQINYPFK